MSLSESLYSFLCVFEIALRNRISNVLVKEFGDNWFDEKAGKWLNGKAATEWQDKNGNTQRARLLQQIDKAKEEINKQNKKINNPMYHKIVTSDTLTPELNFGFWTEIMGWDLTMTELYGILVLLVIFMKFFQMLLKNTILCAILNE